MVEALELEDELLRVGEVVLHEARQFLLLIVRDRRLLTLYVRHHQSLLHTEHLRHYVSDFE